MKELGQWNGQCPPTAKHQKGKVITPKIKEIVGKVRGRKGKGERNGGREGGKEGGRNGRRGGGWEGGREGWREGGVYPLPAMQVIFLSPQSLPEFGPYMEEKERKVAAYKASIVPLEEFPAAVHRPALQPSRPVASVKVCRGIGT